MRKSLVTVLVCVLAVLTSPNSWAHGEIISTSPERLNNINQIPSQVWIVFDGNLQMFGGQAINTIDVVDSTGLTVSTGDPVIDGGKIRTKLSGKITPGIFTVNYRIVSEDGHPVQGSYTFNVSLNRLAAPIATASTPSNKSQLNIGGAVMIFFLVVFGIGLLVKRKNGEK